MEPWPRPRRGWTRVVLFWMGAAVLVASAVWWMTAMPGRSHAGPLPPLRPDEDESRRRLQRHVRALALEIGERNVFRPERLASAAAYIEERLRELSDTPESQEFVVGGVVVRNLDVERRGARHADQIVILGAHYDSVIGSPGADDNATGVAALLEIARLLRGQPLGRSVRFAFFVNEEPPLFQTEAMGSLRYARRCRERGENVVAMLSLESLGFYSDAEDSQQYPFPLGLFYPSRADFVGFVGNLRSRALVRGAVRSFRRAAAFPSQGVAGPASIPGIAWSDHWAFWQQGYPALMVTDTAVFRYPDYHSGLDRPDRVDDERLARVVAGLARTVLDLASSEAGPTTVRRGSPS